MIVDRDWTCLGLCGLRLGMEGRVMLDCCPCCINLEVDVWAWAIVMLFCACLLFHVEFANEYYYQLSLCLCGEIEYRDCLEC